MGQEGEKGKEGCGEMKEQLALHSTSYSKSHLCIDDRLAEQSTETVRTTVPDPAYAPLSVTTPVFIVGPIFPHTSWSVENLRSPTQVQTHQECGIQDPKGF